MHKHMTLVHCKLVYSDIPVIIIDTWDECGSNPSQAGQSKALLDMLTHWSHISSMLKLIITRDDEHMPSDYFLSADKLSSL